MKKLLPVPGTILLVIWMLFACTPPAPSRQPVAEIGQTMTATPAPSVTPRPEETEFSCADIDAHWGRDWSTTISVLEHLQATDQVCGAEPLVHKLYAAHFSYAVTLEESQQVERAITHYRAAFLLDARRQEALQALVRLEALPEPTPPACPSPRPASPDPAPRATPDLSQFVTLVEGQLWWDEAAFAIRGVNYYPRHAPWHRFLEEFDATEVTAELDLIQQAGFNTIRIFLWYEPLFTCQPEAAIPREEMFARLDTLIRLAEERNLKLIVTLNDLPDLTFRPLYTDWARYDAQTTYIVRRYRNVPAILAWDLRNEGDLDYGARDGDPERFTEAEVLAWLAHISDVVRANDPNHLLTAGWWGDPTATAPYVDFLSFHHWEDGEALQRRIEAYRRKSELPLLLEEVGYHSWAAAPVGARDEAQQAAVLEETLHAPGTRDLLGWVVWGAFDFVPEAGQAESYEHFFGLWRSDLTPKPALERLPLGE